MIARAVAASFGGAFFEVRLDEVRSKWSGEAEKAISAIFAEAEARQPSIIFIDEVDGVLRRRSEHDSEVHRNTATFLLTKMEGFAGADNMVSIIAATNRPQDLDESGWRRFDEAYEVGLPGDEERRILLARYLGDAATTLAPPEWQRFVASSAGMSGSEIAALCRRAKRAAAAEFFYASHFIVDGTGVARAAEQNEPHAQPMPAEKHIAAGLAGVKRIQEAAARHIAAAIRDEHAKKLVNACQARAE